MERVRIATGLAVAISVAAVAALALVFGKPQPPSLPYHQGAHLRLEIEAPEHRAYEVDGSCDVYDQGNLDGAPANGIGIVGRTYGGPFVTVGSAQFWVGIELIDGPYVGLPIYAGNGYRDGSTTVEESSADRRSGRARFVGLRSDDGWIFEDHSTPLSGVVEWRCDGPARTFEPDGGEGG
jgi:hypothetical protein